jgi:hypothetical protein
MPCACKYSALAGADGFQFTFEWRPSVAEEPDAARRDAAKVVVVAYSVLGTLA